MGSRLPWRHIVAREPLSPLFAASFSLTYDDYDNCDYNYDYEDGNGNNPSPVVRICFIKEQE